MPKNLVLVTSVICVPSSPLSYAPTRSAFTPQERFEQTLKTIQTCKEKIPNARVVVLEGSVRLDPAFHTGLCAAADDVVADLAARAGPEIYNSPYKATFEVFKLMTYLHDHRSSWNEYDHVFKISGRYWLSDVFQGDTWVRPDRPVALRLLPHGGYSSVFFRVTAAALPTVLDDLDKCVARLRTGECLEYVLFRSRFTPEEIKFIETIGLEGFITLNRQEHIAY